MQGDATLHTSSNSVLGVVPMRTSSVTSLRMCARQSLTGLGASLASDRERLCSAVCRCSQQQWAQDKKRYGRCVYCSAGRERGVSSSRAADRLTQAHRRRRTRPQRCNSVAAVHAPTSRRRIATHRHARMSIAAAARMRSPTTRRTLDSTALAALARRYGCDLTRVSIAPVSDRLCSATCRRQCGGATSARHLQRSDR